MKTKSLILPLLTSVMLAPAAPGQDAMGDGRILDANTNQRGTANVPAPRTDYAARNRLVTGNVVGGRGFRGSVGYTAADAFRGETGSDTLYNFLAGSAWSNVNFATYNTTLNRLRFGQDMGLIGLPAATPAFNAGEAAYGAAIDFAPDINQAVTQRIRVDRINYATSLGAEAESEAEPRIIGGYRTEEGDVFIEASSLAGLAATPVNRLTSPWGISRLDHARLTADVLADRVDAGSVGQAYSDRFIDLLRPDGTIAPEFPDPRVGADPLDPAIDEGQASRPSSLDEIRARVAERALQFGRETDAASTPPPGTILEAFDEEMRRLKESLLGVDELPPDQGDEGERPDRGDDSTRPRPDGSTRPQPDDTPPPDEPDPTLNREPTTLLPALSDTMMSVLRHESRVEHLAGDTQSRMGELIAEGEALLDGGRYLRAERRFDRALRMQSRHPMATAGLGLSQLGAGLFQSAAITVRALFTDRPEMIDVQFESGLQPSPDRLDVAVRTMRDRIVAGESVGDSGLIIAFVGHLTGQDDLVREGLAAMRAADADDRLLPLLEGVWTR